MGCPMHCKRHCFNALVKFSCPNFIRGQTGWKRIEKASVVCCSGIDLGIDSFVIKTRPIPRQMTQPMSFFCKGKAD